MDRPAGDSSDAGPLDLRDYITKNVTWFNSTYITAVTDWDWPRVAGLVIHVEALEGDRPGTQPRVCRIGSRSEYRARCRYKWKDEGLFKALHDIDLSYYIVLVYHEDGRSYCLPLRIPGPEYVIPGDHCCIILSGWETII